MRITIAAPVRPGASSGNDVTVARWQRRLIELGHEVRVMAVDADDVWSGDVDGEPELLVALHARRTASVVAASRRSVPERPIVVGLAGTDLYVDLPRDPDARASVDAADRLVVLQDAAVDRLHGFDPSLARKAMVVHQSVDPPVPVADPDRDRFVVAVLAHLRDVKDPLLAARATRHLPSDSRVMVEHAGHAHDDDWRRRATREAAENPRYRWLGEVDRDAAMGLLARATVLACTSKLEGGANVVSEAIAVGVAVVGTRVDGNTGLLGDDYPGWVPVGDEGALAALLSSLEREPAALAELRERVSARRGITEPDHEREAWAAVVALLS